MVDVGEDVQVMRVIMADLPPALSMEVLKEVAEHDKVYQKLKATVKEGKKPKDRDLVPYMAVWGELTVIKELVYRGERIIIPEGRCTKNDLRDWVIDLGHSAHQGVDATKRQLRVRLWFPGMDKAVKRRVTACLACLASMETKARDPLKPTKAPEELWSRLYADHWGPTQDGHHILVIMDGLTRYPEVAVVKGTSAKDTIQAFGIPRRLHNDNGAPLQWQGHPPAPEVLYQHGYPAHHQQERRGPRGDGAGGGIHAPPQKDLPSGGGGEGGPVPEAELPHAVQGNAMRKCPAELLFGRQFVTKLPDLRTNPAKDRKEIVEANKDDKLTKDKMNKYKDDSRHVRAHGIKVGVIVKRKETKHNSTYDPKPYNVVATYGTQIKGM